MVHLSHRLDFLLLNSIGLCVPGFVMIRGGAFVAAAPVSCRTQPKDMLETLCACMLLGGYV